MLFDHSGRLINEFHKFSSQILNMAIFWSEEKESGKFLRNILCASKIPLLSYEGQTGPKAG